LRDKAQTRLPADSVSMGAEGVENPQIDSRRKRKTEANRGAINTLPGGSMRQGKIDSGGYVIDTCVTISIISNFTSNKGTRAQNFFRRRLGLL
jgi:hypothetical protein